MHKVFIVIALFIQSCANQLTKSNCYQYTVYRHFFWWAVGNISIAAASFLAQCTEHCVTCRNSRKMCVMTSNRILISSIVL